MRHRIKAPVLTVAATIALSGCDLLDVNNPNSLTEESVALEAAATGVTNGSLRMVADAYSEVVQTVGVAADEFFWTGSRDGWNTLDQGLINDPLNEFIDAAFPEVGVGVWMARNAVDILTGHVANNPGDDAFALDLARAQLFRGIILTVTGETQEDMTFSDKMESGPPVGPDNMSTVLDDAIASLDEAVAGFAALGEGGLETRARAVRARAHMSRAIWDQLNPSASVAGAISFDAALADANAVLADVGTADWLYTLDYDANSSDCSVCGWVNNRGENQVEETLVELTTAGTGADGRTGVVALLDPVTGNRDPAVATFVSRFGGNQYGSLAVASARLMHLILAEHELATSGPDFVTHINAIRALDSKAPFAGEVTDLEILQHERRINTLFMGLRLQDMYRWGIVDPRWQSGSTALSAPGTMFPIAIIEVRANCHLNGQGC
jgi:hypothetical protein